MTEIKSVEALSEEIHKLYCAQYEKDHGKPYWTGGDYSLLDERTKEYDRNVARWHIERVIALLKHAQEEIAEIIVPTNDFVRLPLGSVDLHTTIGGNAGSRRAVTILQAMIDNV